MSDPFAFGQRDPNPRGKRPKINGKPVAGFGGAAFGARAQGRFGEQATNLLTGGLPDSGNTDDVALRSSPSQGGSIELDFGDGAGDAGGGGAADGGGDVGIGDDVDVLPPFDITDLGLPPDLLDFLLGGQAQTNITAQGPEFTGESQELLRNIFDQGVGGTINNFDTAANRLRERTTGAARGLTQQATQQGLSSGFQGALQNQLGQIRAGRLGAEAQGLAQLESDFEARRLEALGISSGAAQGIGAQDVAEQGALGDFSTGIADLNEQARQANQTDASSRAQTIANLIEQFRLGEGGIFADILGDLFNS